MAVFRGMKNSDAVLFWGRNSTSGYAFLLISKILPRGDEHDGIFL